MMIESLGVLPVVAEAVDAGGGIIPFQIQGNMTYVSVLIHQTLSMKTVR